MTFAQWMDVIIKILVGLGGLSGVTAFFMVRAQKRKLAADTGKTEAEADSVMADASSKRTSREAMVLDMYEKGMSNLQERLDDAEGKLDRLTAYVEVLVQELRSNGVAVPPMPRKMSDDAQAGNTARDVGPNR